MVIVIRGEKTCNVEIARILGWGPGTAPIELSNHDRTLTIECMDLSAGGPSPCPHLAVLLMEEVDTCQEDRGGWIFETSFYTDKFGGTAR
jgi:hypothetical protein